MDAAETGGTGALSRNQRNWDYHIIRDYVATTGNTDIATMPPNVRYAIEGIDPKIWKGFVAEGKEMAAKKAAMTPSVNRPVSPDVKPIGPGAAPAMDRPGQVNAEGVQILPGRRVGYPGPVQMPQQAGGAGFDFSQFSPAKTGMDNAPTTTVTPSTVASAQTAAKAGYDAQTSDLTGGNEPTEGVAPSAPSTGERVQKSFFSLKPENIAQTFMGLIGHGLDAYGASLLAHAGKDSSTMLQREMAMRLESQRAANQAYAFADAEISKLEPTLQKEIRAAIAQGRIDVARDLAIKAGNFPLEKALMELQNKILYVNNQTDMRTIADPRASGLEWTKGTQSVPKGGS